MQISTSQGCSANAALIDASIRPQLQEETSARHALRDLTAEIRHCLACRPQLLPNRLLAKNGLDRGRRIDKGGR
jgi:hypothetical protein